MNFCNHRTTVNCDRCRPPAPEQEGPRVEPTEYDGQNDWVGVFLGERCVYKCRPATLPADTNDGRPSKRSAREYLAQVSNHERAIKAHLPRLYRELGIAEERTGMLDCIVATMADHYKRTGKALTELRVRDVEFDALCDELIGDERARAKAKEPGWLILHGTTRVYCSRAPDPSIISTELGEFRVDWQEKNRVVNLWRGSAFLCWLGIDTDIADATLWDAKRRMVCALVVGGNADLGAWKSGMAALAPVFQRLGIAEEPGSRVLGLDDSPGVDRTWDEPAKGMTPREYRSTVKAEDVGPRCRAFIGATGDKCSLDVGHAGHCGHATVKTQAQEMAEAEQAMRDASNKYKAAMAAKAEKERAATRERALKAGAHSPALKTFFLGEGPQTPPVECVHPACTPEEQEHRAAYVKEKLFAKRSSKPSVGWDPYGDDGEG